MQRRRALLVGLNDYDNYPPLQCCAADARAMAELLAYDSNDEPNFECRVVESSFIEPVTRERLRSKWTELFSSFRGDVLFYFSGHGELSGDAGYLVTQEATPAAPGLTMHELVEMANTAAADTVLIILDCCHSGAAANPGTPRGGLENSTVLREGVTIIAASRAEENAKEIGSHGVFTELVLGALRGGAANVQGHVSAAAIYAYVEAALADWTQRPIYKSHAAHLAPVRRSQPKVENSLLKELPDFFAKAETKYQLDRTYEETNKEVAIAEHVAIFKKFKQLQIAGLLQPEFGNDLYWTAENKKMVVLTTLGHFYHRLAVGRRF